MTRATLDKLRAMGMNLGPQYDKLADTLEASRKSDGENAKVSKIEYKPIDSKVENYKYFEVKITLNTEYYTNLVEVEIDGRIFQATRKSNTFEQQAFYATVFVDLSQSSKKEEIYKLTATLKDLIGVVTNLKSIVLKIENKNEVYEGKCFCKAQGLIKNDCLSKGGSISDEMFETLSNEINIEKSVMYAIAKQESKKEPFMQNEPKKATILLERHYVYRLFKKKYDEQKADLYQTINSNLCDKNVTEKGKYGTFKEQYDRLEAVKKWDETIAIQSCSWGKFQVMGEYFNSGNIYKSAIEFETAMNLCEIQHFKYFKIFLVEIGGMRLIKALQEKNWKKIAEVYNGKNWFKINPEYANNLKK